MARKRHSDEGILKLLREIELKLAAGSDVASACRGVGVSDATYYNWRKRFGGMGRSQLLELRSLEKGNARLKKIVAELELDKLCNGRSYKMLTVLDEYTRQALAVNVRVRIGTDDVLEALYPLLMRQGTPEYIRSDNGPEFVAEAMQDWLARVSIKPIRIYPGSPWENGYNERFNGTLRQEVLNAEWFTTTTQAQIVINQWLRQYNHIRPH